MGPPRRKSCGQSRYHISLNTSLFLLEFDHEHTHPGERTTMSALRVVAYLRVSTQGQADNGYGLDNQEEACRDRAQTLGHELVAVLREEGVSGAKADRPVLAEALGMLKNKEADAVMVYRLDRLARDLVLQEILLNEILAAGGVLLSATAGEDELLADPQEPTRKLLRQMMGAFAEYERALITLRLAAGRAAKRKAGKGATAASDWGFVLARQGLGPLPVRLGQRWADRAGAARVDADPDAAACGPDAWGDRRVFEHSAGSPAASCREVERQVGWARNHQSRFGGACDPAVN